MTYALTFGIARKIDSLGRIVIPSEIRQLLGLNEGDIVEIDVEDGSIVLHPMIEQCPVCGLPQRSRPCDPAAQERRSSM
jgi:AbrB family looped-hinge helix DNA binding protein